jgi:hypothetical protein
MTVLTNWVRRLSCLVLMASPVALVPSPAQAGDLQWRYTQETFTHQCLQGQLVQINPGNMRSLLYSTTGAGTNKLGGEILQGSATVDTVEGARLMDLEGNISGSEVTFPVTLEPTPFAPGKTFVLTRALFSNGDDWEYDASTVTCGGDPLDSDGDGTPDELDACPNVASPRQGGCPATPVNPVLTVTSIVPSHWDEVDQVDQADGSISFTVTNTVDETAANASYTFTKDGTSVLSAVGPLADGQVGSEQMLDNLSVGTYSLCAIGDDGTQGCQSVQVPQSSDTAAHGSTSVIKTAQGMTVTVTNDGRRTARFHLWSHNAGGLVELPYMDLAVGESMSLSLGRVFDAKIEAYIEPVPGFGMTKIATYVWRPPAGATPLKGGTKVVKWGKVTNRHPKPRITVKTSAQHARIGYQWSRGSTVDWSKVYGPGRHVIRTDAIVPRHGSRPFRVWVVYYDTQDFRTEPAPVGGWHVYKR